MSDLRLGQCCTHYCETVASFLGPRACFTLAQLWCETRREPGDEARETVYCGSKQNNNQPNLHLSLSYIQLWIKVVSPFGLLYHWNSSI